MNLMVMILLLWLLCGVAGANRIYIYCTKEASYRELYNYNGKYNTNNSWYDECARYRRALYGLMVLDIILGPLGMITSYTVFRDNDNEL